ncbi:MAG: hypothetical protein ABIJ46_02660 [bacterium]
MTTTSTEELFRTLSEEWMRGGLELVSTVLVQTFRQGKRFTYAESHCLIGGQNGKAKREVFYGQLLAFVPGIVLFDAHDSCMPKNLSGMMCRPDEDCYSSMLALGRPFCADQLGRLAIYRRPDIDSLRGSHDVDWIDGDPKKSIVLGRLLLDRSRRDRLEVFLNRWLPVD